MARYVFIGAGAVGATVAAGLHGAGREVLLIARGAHLAALRENGLRLARPDGERVLRLPVAAGPDEVALHRDDVLVLAVKSQDTEGALQAWAHRPVDLGGGRQTSAAEALPLLTLQNGLDNERAALRRFATVIGATTWLPAAHLAPGEVSAPGVPAAGALWLGRYPDGGAAVLPGIAGDLRAAGFEVQTVPDIRRWKAAKLLDNLANALDALYRPGPVRERALDALRAEGAQVLAAAGLDPADMDAESTVDRGRFRIAPVAGRAHAGSSTRQSLARSAPPETDFLNGEIVLLARLAGREAPLNAAVARRLHRAAAQGTAPGSLDDADLLETLPSLRAEGT